MKRDIIAEWLATKEINNSLGYKILFKNDFRAIILCWDWTEEDNDWNRKWDWIEDVHIEVDGITIKTPESWFWNRHTPSEERVEIEKELLHGNGEEYVECPL